MPKQILSDAAQQARNLARQIGSEILKEPELIAKEAARSTAVLPQEIPEPSPPQAAVSSPPKSQSNSSDAQLAAARAKIRSFSQKRSQEWQKTEIQAQQTHQKRVQQIVEAQLGHTPQTEPDVLGLDKEKEKGKGIIGELKNIFKGKRSRKMGAGGVGQAKKQASGEFNKSQQ